MAVKADTDDNPGDIEKGGAETDGMDEGASKRSKAMCKALKLSIFFSRRTKHIDAELYAERESSKKKPTKNPYWFKRLLIFYQAKYI